MPSTYKYIYMTYYIQCNMLETNLKNAGDMLFARSKVGPRSLVCPILEFLVCLVCQILVALVSLLLGAGHILIAQ
jgi:hypothetical protein